MKKKLVLLTMLLVLALGTTACGGGLLDGALKQEKDNREEDSKDEELTDEDENTDEKDVEEEKSSEENTQPGELSDDIYDFQISINGTVYQFPMWAKDFAKQGWTFAGNEEGVLDSYEYTVAETWKKDDIGIYTTLANMTLNSVSYSEAMVAGVDFDKWDLKECDWDIELAKGIVYGKSTTDDIIAAYGEPTSDYDGDLYYKMTYRYGSYREVELYVYKDSGVLEGIEITNIVELEGGNNEVDSTVPDAVKEYKAPKELGNDLTVYNVEIEGKLYTFPCPVSEFLNNGWKLDESNSEMAIGAGSSGRIYLQYGNQTHTCIVDNVADYATIPGNCFMTYFDCDEYYSDFEMVIPGDIRRGTSETVVLNVLKDYDYEEETSGDYTYYYIHQPGQSYTPYFCITVKDGKVTELDVKL